MRSLAHVILNKKPITTEQATARRAAEPIKLIDKGTTLATIALLILGASCTAFIYQFASGTQGRDTTNALQSVARVKAVNLRATFQQLQDSAYALGANLEQLPTADAGFDALAWGARAGESGRVTTPEPLFPRLDVETEAT